MEIALIAAIIVTLAILIGLAVIPVPHAFYMQISTDPKGVGGTSLSFPSGSHVSGKWKTASGDSVSFFVLGQSDHLVVEEESAPGGYFNFSGGSNPYLFVVESSLSSETVTVWWNVSYPML